MRVEIYQENEEKILKGAGELNISPTDLVNKILASANFKFEFIIDQVDIVIKKSIKKEDDPSKQIVKSVKGKNFVTNW